MGPRERLCKGAGDEVPRSRMIKRATGFEPDDGVLEVGDGARLLVTSASSATC